AVGYVSAAWQGRARGLGGMDDRRSPCRVLCGRPRRNYFRLACPQKTPERGRRSTQRRQFLICPHPYTKRRSSMTPPKLATTAASERNPSSVREFVRPIMSSL